VLAVPKDEGAEPTPQGRQAAILEPAKGTIPRLNQRYFLGPAPLHQLGEEVFHHTARSLFRQIAHQVEAQLLAAGRGPDVRERDDSRPTSNDDSRKQREVSLVEAPE
jgi:hypothetical protein